MTTSLSVLVSHVGVAKASIELLLAPRHHRLVLVPEPRVQPDEGSSQGVGLGGINGGYAKLDPDVGRPVVHRRQPREDLRADAPSSHRAAPVAAMRTVA